MALVSGLNVRINWLSRCLGKHLFFLANHDSTVRLACVNWGSRVRLTPTLNSFSYRCARGARSPRSVDITPQCFARAAIAKRQENKLVYPTQIIPQVYRNHSSKPNKTARLTSYLVGLPEIIILNVFVFYIGHPGIGEQWNKPKPCNT